MIDKYTKSSNNILYQRYSFIKQRCYNPNNKSYKKYGAKGIVLSDEFMNDFNSFVDHMVDDLLWKPDQRRNQNIVLINKNGNFERGNIVLLTQRKMSDRRIEEYKIDFKGGRYTLTEIGNMVGISRTSIHWRINHGVPLEKLKYKQETYLYKGERLLIHELVKKSGLNRSVVIARMERNKPLEDPVHIAKTYVFHGEMKTISEISKLTGINIGTISARVYNNIPFDKPIGQKYLYNGKMMSVKEIALAVNISQNLVYYRMRKGLPLKKELVNK